MTTRRIKDLPLSSYNGSYKIAIDSEEGSGSLELSSLPDTTYNIATSTEDGLMSSNDKGKLDGIVLSVCTQEEYDTFEKIDGVFYFIKES